MSRYIDADTLRAKLCGWLDCVYQTTEGGQWDDGEGGAIAECVQELDDTPTADVAQVVHSKWHQTDYHDFHCMNCGNLVHKPKKFCDECGAKMYGRKPMDNRCICCGEIIPEGRQVCPSCERKEEEE